MNKFLKILGYTLLIIILIPIAVIGLYLAVGGILFIVLYILNRKKNGPIDAVEGKTYKIASAILFIIGITVLFYIYKVNFFSIEAYLWMQLITFIGLLPVCYFLFNLIKNKE